MNNFKILESKLKPYTCYDKIRIGSKYDGGYIMPKQTLIDSDCLVSFGISTNIDFEKEFYQNNKLCDILMFDPFIGISEDFNRLMKRVFTLKDNPSKREILLEDNPTYIRKKEHLIKQCFSRAIHWIDFNKFISEKNIHFSNIGVRNYCDDKFINFQKLFEKQELQNKKSIVLKIDIEGDEYNTFDDLINYLDNVSTILYEFHEVKINNERIIAIIDSLNSKGFYLIHTHGNNSDILVEGTTIPNTLELSFCRKRYCDPLKMDTNHYPMEGLDNPCNAQKIDYHLDFLNQ